MVFESIKGEPRAKKIVLGAHAAGKIAGAYIFQGQNIEEMADFAKEFAMLLNCETACGKCLNCRKIESGVHPDFVTIIPEGKKQIIKIDSIRDLKDRVKLGPVEGKYFVIRVINADSIEPAAANSFLKALEEPPQGVVFILITTATDNLPRTVLSRCQKIIFANQTEDQLEAPDLPKSYDIPSLLTFSSELAQLPKESERQEAEKKLQVLTAHFFKKRDFPKARIIISAMKDLKKNANIKLLLDRMALTLGGWIKCLE
ncbi:MAG: hypothetical protein WC527_02840 [Candidatus Margulisiibacteriota bacterium]